MATLVIKRAIWKCLIPKIPRISKHTSHVSITGKRDMSTTMFQVIHDKYGDPREVLHHRTLDLSRKLEADELLVKFMMSPINPSDINMVEGTYFIHPPLPAVVGNEGVAQVLEKGSMVSEFEVGDWAIPSDSGFGTWCDYKVCNMSNLIRVSKDIPMLAAATLSVNPTSAYRMLNDYVHLQSGDYVLQNGANSSVGQCVVQLAKIWGIKTINIVRDRPENDVLKTYLTSLGGDHVFTEEYARSPAMKDFMKSLSNAPKLALNCVGGKSATELLRYLAPCGTMVTYGGMSKKPIVVPTGSLIFKEIRLSGYWNTQWNKNNENNSKRNDMFNELCQFIKAKTFVPPTSELVHITQYKDAVLKAMDGYSNKKYVLVMD